MLNENLNQLIKAVKDILYVTKLYDSSKENLSVFGTY